MVLSRVRISYILLVLCNNLYLWIIDHFEIHNDVHISWPNDGVGETDGSGLVQDD